MTISIDSRAVDGAERSLSLDPAAARKLATTTKSPPQMQGISTRWLLRLLPWVQVEAGTYRVNRRLSYSVGNGLLSFTTVGDRVRAIPGALRELPALHGFGDAAVLEALADRFVQRDFETGEVIVESGQPANALYLVAFGKLEQLGRAKFGDEVSLSLLGEGDRFGDEGIGGPPSVWRFTARALTPATVLILPLAVFDELARESTALAAQVAAWKSRAERPQDKDGQPAISVSAGHRGEAPLTGTFVDYDPSPREYELGVAQTILRIHTRVADLYNDPMSQLEQQLRLTVEALRETQEDELVNNREFGLLHNVDPRHRLQTRRGPPTPDDLDELLTRRRQPRLLLAHPRAIAAFGAECNRLGVVPPTVEVQGAVLPSWRGIPLLPCDKIPITAERTTSILVLRTGLEDQGVIGLHQVGIPDEYEPSLNVRFMGISDQAIASYLVSAYYSVAVLVPDALGVLDNVAVGG